MVVGRHQFAFGAEYIRRTLDFQVSTQQNPEFDFNGQFSNDPLSDLLLGRNNQFIQGNLTKVDEQSHYFAVYAHDKVRLSPRLSLNAGLRWEPYFPAHDIYGRSTHFDMGGFLAGQRSTKFTNAPPGLSFPGDPGMPKGATIGHLAISLPASAWSGIPKETARTTFAVLTEFYTTAAYAIFRSFRLRAALGEHHHDRSSTRRAHQSLRGYPGGNPFPQPSPPPANATFVQAGQYVNLPLHIDTTYMQQWNFSVQQQVGDAWLFTANYLGNKSTHRWINRAINPAVFIPGNCGNQAARPPEIPIRGGSCPSQSRGRRIVRHGGPTRRRSQR